jgi:hypothetical protein
MGRITPSFRQLYEEIISELRTELQAALVDLSHKSAFDLMASIHNRKLIAVLTKGLKEKDLEIKELKQHVSSLENKLNDVYLIIKNREQQQHQETELHKEIIQEIIEE